MVNRDLISETSRRRKGMHFQMNVGAGSTGEVVCGTESDENRHVNQNRRYREEAVVVTTPRKARGRSGIPRLSSHSCHYVSLKCGL